eukprot:gnl/Spiro4/6807_TR3521_c0_g1_i1.p2 gnl/Spiro4/6807_TR3521_c0_g1~~gnl/Spiro4/6807_TR3521_c0_g1_i1.p2  ORF type:complete len:143 (+),score=44.34 gnl/Spiro4/6807_TR3521_c0_g1_i1:76-504(+)
MFTKGRAEAPFMMKQLLFVAQRGAQDLKGVEFTGTSIKGLVVATLSGNGKLLNLKIADSVARDVDAVEVLTMEAINAAASQISKTLSQQAAENGPRIRSMLDGYFGDESSSSDFASAADAAASLGLKLDIPPPAHTSQSATV